MQRQPRFRRSCAGAAYGLPPAAGPVSAVAAAEGPVARPVTMRGTIVAVDGERLTVATRGGETKVGVLPDAPILGCVSGKRRLGVPGAGVAVFRATRMGDRTPRAGRVTAGRTDTKLPMEEAARKGLTSSPVAAAAAALGLWRARPCVAAASGEAQRMGCGGHPQYASRFASRAAVHPGPCEQPGQEGMLSAAWWEGGRDQAQAGVRRGGGG